MGFIQLIDTIIKANLPVSYQDQPNYAELTYNSLTRQGVSSPFDTLNFQALYSLNSDVYAAVNTIATKLAQLPFKVTVPRGDELEDITDSPDLDIFRTLNGRDT
ncbi:MAG TPA: hypothetical protein ENH85_13520, partial [Candidatus Scalindua sp.]|nr:hypothetical protein [Candidatus Scalindua sp.]